MPFIIQGQDVAAVPETQSPWYETDIAILVAGIAGTGVLTGCAVAAQGSPDMTVAVASGTIQPSAGVAAVPVTGANKTITTADGDDPRIDLVSASAAGVLTVTDGTPAPIVPGVSGPKPPALPSGHIALAMIDVPAADTTIATAQITDKRVMVFAAGGVADILDIPTAEMDDTLVLAPDGTGGVEFRAEAGGGGAGTFTSLAGWTQLGTLDTSNVTDVPGLWHAIRACSSEIDGIYQAVPSTPFTIMVKVAAYGFPGGATHPSIGIMLLDATPTAIREFSFNLAGGSTWSVSLRRYTNRTSFSSSVDVVTGYPLATSIYLRLLVTSSSSVTFSYSWDNLIWVTPAQLTAIDPTLTPAYVGLLLSDPVSASAPEVFFDEPVFT